MQNKITRYNVISVRLPWQQRVIGDRELRLQHVKSDVWNAYSGYNKKKCEGRFQFQLKPDKSIGEELYMYTISNNGFQSKTNVLKISYIKIVLISRIDNANAT